MNWCENDCSSLLITSTNKAVEKELLALTTLLVDQDRKHLNIDSLIYVGGDVIATLDLSHDLDASAKSSLSHSLMG